METVGGKIFQAIPAIMGEINAVGKNLDSLPVLDSFPLLVLLYGFLHSDLSSPRSG